MHDNDKPHSPLPALHSTSLVAKYIGRIVSGLSSYHLFTSLATKCKHSGQRHHYRHRRCTPFTTFAIGQWKWVSHQSYSPSTAVRCARFICQLPPGRCLLLPTCHLYSTYYLLTVTTLSPSRSVAFFLVHHLLLCLSPVVCCPPIAANVCCWRVESCGKWRANNYFQSKLFLYLPMLIPTI